MAASADAGRRGDEVRSDSWVRFEETDSGGVEIRLTSKVESMYGDATRAFAGEVLRTLGMKSGIVEIEDSGAVPFVIAARIESAVKRALPENGEIFPSERFHGTRAEPKRDRMRRSRLYLPGNEPKFFLNAALHTPDAVILDLEDSVAATEKDTARLVVRNALRSVDFGVAERMVRINQAPLGLDDLDAVIPEEPNVILIPKAETADSVSEVCRRIDEIQSKTGKEYEIYLMPIVESALGVVNAYEIATASPKVIALTIGLEDYTADIGAARTAGAKESYFARSAVVNAARAAGVSPIDSVFSDVGDTEGLRRSALESKSLGFEGMGCIHPRQIGVIHEALAPTSDELAKAIRIVEAFEEATAAGSGVVSLGSKMIDPPVVKRALRTVRLAAEGKGQ